VFSWKRHCFSWTFFRLDPARSDLDLGAQFSYHIPRPDPLRPDPVLSDSKIRSATKQKFHSFEAPQAMGKIHIWVVVFTHIWVVIMTLLAYLTFEFGWRL
jgi:hypothetical protein